MEEDDLRELAETLYDVRAVIMPYPKTCAEAFSGAQRIYADIEEMKNLMTDVMCHCTFSTSDWRCFRVDTLVELDMDYVL